MNSDNFKCFLCDYGWILFLLIVIGLAAFFSRNLWMPGVFPTDSQPAIVSSPIPVATKTIPPIRSVMPTTMSTQTILHSPTVEIGVDEGKQAADFELENLSGEALKLSDQFGEPILLIGFGAGCPHCQNEASFMQSIYTDYQDRGVQIIMVNAWDESEIQIQEFINKFNLEFSVLMDPDGEFSRTYHIEGVPTNIFINSEGMITQIIVGELGEKDFRGFMDRYLFD